MLLSTNKITGYALEARDGRIGEITSLLFDDRDWTVRYVVAKTMRWLGREVLISPEAFGTPDWSTASVPVELTRQQIKDSPAIDLDAPVTHQHLHRLHSHYGWAGWWGMPAQAMAMPPVQVAEAEPDGDPHLRGTAALNNYTLEATDGNLGHVQDFIVDTDAWKLRYVVVDTRNWLPGKRVLILPEHVGEIDWAHSTIAVTLTKEQVKDSPEYDPSLPINRELESRLFDFHGKPSYWA